MCSALPLCPVSIKDQKVSESIRKKYLHIGFWRWCKANEGKEKETVVVFIVAVKCFSVLTSKEETLSPQWEIFIFHWRAQWAHLLLISCTFSDRSEAAHSHTSGLSKPQLLYKEHLYYSSWVCVCGGGRPVHYSVGAVTLTVSVLREIGKYTSPRLTNSKATCIFVHNPWQIWWIIWCRVMMPAASLFLLLALNRLNCNRHKERLVANNPWPQLLWIYADQ